MPGPVEGSMSGVGEGVGDCENAAAEPIVKDAARIAAVRVIDFKPGSICFVLPEKCGARIRAVNRGVAYRAVLVSQHRLVVERRNVGRRLLGDTAVTFETKLAHAASLEHLRIRRAVWSVACRASLDLQRSMFENERASLIAVALDARCVGTDRELRLFLLEASMRIVTIAAVHRSFKDLVMKWLAELRLCFGVTRHAKLRFVRTEHRACSLSGFLVSHIRREGYRARTKIGRLRSVCAVAFRAAYVITPVFTSTKVVVILFSRMAR